MIEPTVEVIAPAVPLPKRVLIVGMGSLGCPASMALFAAGVHDMTFVDPDMVDLTNLHRQPWHRPRCRSSSEDAKPPTCASARATASRSSARSATRARRTSFCARLARGVDPPQLHREAHAAHPAVSRSSAAVHVAAM
jgi:ThiF family